MFPNLVAGGGGADLLDRLAKVCLHLAGPFPPAAMHSLPGYVICTRARCGPMASAPGPAHERGTVLSAPDVTGPTMVGSYLARMMPLPLDHGAAVRSIGGSSEPCDSKEKPHS